MSRFAFELYRVAVDRGRRPVLDIERLQVPRGQVLAVVGPNGAGKTTLLHLLALLQDASAGELLCFGRPVKRKSERLALRRRTAMVLQEPVLLDLSVQDNVALPLRLRGWPAARARPAAVEWLDRFGVAHLARRPARALSGGEAQRVSLARALVTRPDVLLLDEPFASLDWPTKLRLIEDLGETLRAARLTAVLVTHDLTEVPHLAQRVAILLDGRIRRLIEARELPPWVFDPAQVLAKGARWWDEVAGSGPINL